MVSVFKSMHLTNNDEDQIYKYRDVKNSGDKIEKKLVDKFQNQP